MSNWIWLRLLLGVSSRFDTHCGTDALCSLGTERLEQRMLLSVTSSSEFLGTDTLIATPVPAS
ncbi:MAG: hypothetical protein HOK57_01245, partial [Planctomycetaceae bacterium]|nr:hypothetical protein [Planctomycetaceae bacterium]